MGTPRLKLKQLRRILRSFGATEDKSAGKGSHTVFIKALPSGAVTYPNPHNKQ